MSKVVLHEGPLRGFLSNYISLLTAYKRFVGDQGMHYKDVLIAPDNFIMYGDPRNWFDVDVTTEIPSDVIHCNTDVICEIEDYPRPTQLSLVGFQPFVPYNHRVLEYLVDNLADKKHLDKCLGVHYRGTDHHLHHMARIDMDELYKNIGKQLETGNYEQMFICSDELNKVEEIQEYVSTNFKFHNFVVNDNIKSSGTTAVFFLDFDQQTKIRLGDEVLLDAHMLSNCDYVICKASNIINYARILNLKLNGIYLDSKRGFFKDE